MAKKKSRKPVNYSKAVDQSLDAYFANGKISHRKWVEIQYALYRPKVRKAVVEFVESKLVGRVGSVAKVEAMDWAAIIALVIEYLPEIIALIEKLFND